MGACIFAQDPQCSLLFTNVPLLPRPVARLQSFGFSETISNSEVDDEFSTLCGRPRAMETC